MAIQVILAAAAIVAAAGAVGIMFELKSLRTFLARERLDAEVARSPADEMVSSQSARSGRSKDGYAIYVYRQSRWVLEQDFSAPGFRPVPPRLEGAYEGQALRVAATAEATAGR